MGRRIYVFLGIGLAVGFAYQVAVYRANAEKQRLVDYTASIVRYIPQLAFEKGRPLSLEEKQAALDLTIVDNRIALAAGLLSGDFEKEKFGTAYFVSKNPTLEPPKNEFDKRDRAKRAFAEGVAGYTKAKAEWAIKAAKLATLPVSITFTAYHFQSQAFGVKPASLVQASDIGGFGVSVFRDTPEPTQIRGVGSSTFERAASGHSAFQVTSRLWPVPEDMAKDVDVRAFQLFAKVYFDISKSNTDGQTTFLYCTQIDLFADEQLTVPLGSQGCASLNIVRKWF